MAVEKWSEGVTVARLTDDPLLTEDLQSVEKTVSHGMMDVVLDFSAVHFVNSSVLARLLKLRKQIAAEEHRLVLCNVHDQVWGAFMVTGLDKLFLVSDNVTTALATLQMAR
ncbi:MAG TPA: STAS domain-containing protein [Tepidisphaeraceae bacterium]|nr:STAS domain-containing protein [Tepidisphaeraceae bacterium]